MLKTPAVAKAAVKRSRKLFAALDHLVERGSKDAAEALVGLVDALRPANAGNAAQAGVAIDSLVQALSQRPDARDALRAAVLSLLADHNAIHLYTDTGILGNESFRQAFSHRLWGKLLPDEINPERVKDLVGLIFPRREDYRWIEVAPDASWTALFDVLDFSGARGSAEASRILLQMLEALEVLSYRITAIGLEPEIVRIYPEIEFYESPFLMQNVEMRHLFEHWQKALQEGQPQELDDKHLLVLLEQCDEVVKRIRKLAQKRGASVALTYLLVRITQIASRMRSLLSLLQPKAAADANAEQLDFLRRMVRAECRRNSLGDLVKLNGEMLAGRIVSHAGDAGEQYITSTRREYFRLMFSAMGAGGLVAIMAAVKLKLGHVPHAPFVQAVLYSANYAAGFLLMYVCHFSLATKQPAMTASRIAHSMDVPDNESERDRLDGLAELIVRTLRSQFVAIFGNIVVAVPLALLLSQLLADPNGVPYPGPGTVPHLTKDIDPLDPLVWLHAALTGIALFLTGLISGYYDNQALYSRIPQRLARLRPLQALGARRAKRIANYIGANLGGLVGSATFGLMLGSIAAIGTVLGLPLDTLHVTFVSANTAYAAETMGGAFAAIALPSVAAIAIIGTLNLTVSFGLALYVAMRARRVKFRQVLPLLRKLLQRLERQPLSFVFPPREAKVVEQNAAIEKATPEPVNPA